MTARRPAAAEHADAQRAAVLEAAARVRSGDPAAAADLAVLVIRQDGDLSAGGLLPSAWADHAADDRTARPVTDVPLPGDGPAASPASAEFRARVRRRHGPVPSRHGRAAYCVLDGQPWKCETVTLLDALDAAGPALRLLAGNRDLLDSALADAAGPREGAGYCEDCDIAGPCPDHAADERKAGEYARLRGQLRELP